MLASEGCLRNMRYCYFYLADGESETVEIPDTKGNVAATFTVTMKDGQAQVETDSTKPYTVVVHQ